MQNAEYVCPKCAVALVEAGQTHRCEKCDGAWIAEASLVAILEQRTATALGDLEWAPRPEDKARPCAQCQQAMQMVNLGSVELDRCAAHGVWFDADELTALLKQSKRLKTQPPIDDADEADDAPHRGILGALARLFKR